MRFALVVVAVAAGVTVACARDAPRPLGVAVANDTGGWCAMFPPTMAGDMRPGRAVALAFPQQQGRQAVKALLASAQPGQCPAPFAQSRWDGYSAFHLELPGGAVMEVPWPAVAVVIDGSASSGGGDSAKLRACLADEGMHFTLWRDGVDGTPERVWHEYYDLGAFVDQTCGPGEDGRQGP
jgi:hypothetical protein